MKRYRGNSQPPIDLGEYEPTKEERFAAYWCWENNIIVYTEVKQTGPWRICVKLKGKTNCTTELFGKDENIKKVFEYYKYYYDKYRDKKTV